MATRVDIFALGPDQLDDEARRVAKHWVWYLIGGIALAAIGLLLLFNLVEAAHTLALLIALSLGIEGIEEIMNASRYQRKWPGYLMGALLLVTAIVAAVWPDITLWALAVIVGIGFIITGIAELVLVLRYHHDLSYRWLFIALGVITLLIGIMALVWPEATILVLAILLGFRVLMLGIILIMFALGLRKLTTA
jgi:uncharacterized membrane protein HdeD (DUF308 family)